MILFSLLLFHLFPFFDTVKLIPTGQALHFWNQQQVEKYFLLYFCKIFAIMTHCFE